MPFSKLFLLLSVLSVSQILSETICRQNEFRCKDGRNCIDNQKVCNGQIDCLDHSDEENCTDRKCLNPEWFLCADNKTCLSHKFVCDGFENCPIGDDEKGCDTVMEKHPDDHCSKYEYTCSDKSCIPLGLECDGKKDCPDNSDETEGCEMHEKNCPGFLCKNKKCLTDTAWVCDEQNDCGDGSDEIGCSSHCQLSKNQFFCQIDASCISLEKVCNGQNDCKDGSDESPRCHNSTLTCTKCPGKCLKLPTGPLCVCDEGFKFNSTSNTCDDIDECTIYGICDHGCVNTKGSYYCTCNKQFTLDADQRTCIVQTGEPVMLYTTQKTVVGVNLKTRHFYQISQFLSQVVGVAYDGNYVYWTDINQNEESIERAKIDGSKRGVLLTVGLETPEDIAIDWYTGNIYFTDNKNRHLAVCSNHGFDCLILIQYAMDQPRGIVLDPQNGKIYWSDWGKKPHIGRGSMDGTNIDKLVQVDIHWPNGLALDRFNGRLYWADAKLGKIQSVKQDGSDRRVILDNVPKHPYELAIFEDKLYWSDWGTNSIHSIDKFTGKHHEIIIKDRKIYDIDIYHPAMMPKSNHSCQEHLCTHLCLLNDKNSFSCACPEGMILESDMKTCKDYGKKQKLFIGIGNVLVVMEHTVFGRHKIGDGIPFQIFMHKMEYNSVNGTLFVADNHQRAIFEIDWEKRKTMKLVSRGVENVSSLSFDHLGENLYWTDSHLQSIEVLSLKNRERAIIHRFTENVVPLAALILSDAGKLFVALQSDFDTHIDIISLHGQKQHHHFAEEHLGEGIIQFVNDPLSETVFWLDSDEDKIEFSDYEGTIRHLFRTFLNEPMSITLLEEDIFWTIHGSRNIYWTHRSNLGSVKKFTIEKLPYMEFPDVIPITASSPHYVTSHPCKHDNGGCSHICLAAGKTYVSCLCPVGLVFKDQTNKTCIELLDCEFRCKSGECITSSRRCNGIKDCIDGSDELNCGKQRNATCKLNEFGCHDGERCISKDQRCDNHPDCSDNSDEAHCEHFDHETKCHKMQFACENGRCLDPLMLCDGSDDCGDNSDEAAICKSEHHWDEVCGPDMFRCTSGQCIPKKWECDGHLDCKSGSDEHERCPSNQCPPKTFRCKQQGICIDQSLKCDGHNDCGDYSDEINCEETEKSKIQCGNSTEQFEGDPSKFQCKSNPEICLDITAKCNGTSECPRGEDEADCHGCRHDEFECYRSKICIRKQFRCDQERDCDDGSDEMNCHNYNGTETHSFAMACREGMFNCKDGTCIDQLRVCDGVRDCSHGEDELSGCKTSCINHSCEQICKPSPYGAICDCNPGYRLGGNKKMCIDVNECSEMNPCAQICENNYGSYRCSCYPDFMLWSDKVRCKSIERGHYLLFSSFNQLRKLSENPSTLEIIYRSNSSLFTGLDVNVRRNLAYFTMKDTGSLFEYNLSNGNTKFISELGNPKKVAVDWITNNVYFIDDSMRHSINVCHFSNKSTCARLISFKRKDNIKTIAVDAVSKVLFYSVMNFITQPITSIYRAELDGTRPKLLISKSMDVSAMEPDPYKKVLYYTDLESKSLRSINYAGDDPKVHVKHERAIVYPSGLSIFEDTAFIINTGSPEGLWCPLYGRKPCRAIALNVYNAEDVVIVAPSRQKMEKNSCLENKCSLICVQAQLGPKCLCEDGSFVQPGVKCAKSSLTEVGFRVANDIGEVERPSESESEGSSSRALTICLILFGLILVGYIGYVLYKRRTGSGKFRININFSNPLVRPPNAGVSSGTSMASKISFPVMSFSKGKSEVALDSRRDTYKSARNIAGSEDSDCESMRGLDNFDDNPRARLVA